MTRTNANLRLCNSLVPTSSVRRGSSFAAGIKCSVGWILSEEFEMSGTEELRPCQSYIPGL
jgi:hypothetical protein